MSKAIVYILQHSYERDNCDEMKMIGIYSSYELAEAAIERLRPRPGFNVHPSGFSINAYRLDQDHWIEGFVMVPSIEGTSEE